MELIEVIKQVKQLTRSLEKIKITNIVYREC